MGHELKVSDFALQLFKVIERESVYKNWGLYDRYVSLTKAMSLVVSPTTTVSDTVTMSIEETGETDSNHIFRTPYEASAIGVFGTYTDLDGVYTPTGRFVNNSPSWQSGISIVYEHCTMPGTVIWKQLEDGEYKWFLAIDMFEDSDSLSTATILYEAFGSEEIKCPPCGDLSFRIYSKWELEMCPVGDISEYLRVVCLDAEAQYPKDEVVYIFESDTEFSVESDEYCDTGSCTSE